MKERNKQRKMSRPPKAIAIRRTHGPLMYMRRSVLDPHRTCTHYFNKQGKIRFSIVRSSRHFKILIPQKYLRA